MDMLKTTKLRGLIESDSRFELLNRVGMPLICFKLRGRSAEDQERLCNELNKTNKIFMGVAADRGDIFLRLMFGIFTQTDEHIQATWDLIKETTDRLFFA